MVNSFILLFLFGLPLFLPAGSLRYWNAWLFIGSFVLFYLAAMTYFSINNLPFALSRLQTQEAERTQRIVVPLALLCWLFFAVSFRLWLPGLISDSTGREYRYP